VGEIAMFGGKILVTRTYPSYSEIAVLQMPLDSSGRPQDTDNSEGRFLIRSEQFLDPAVYKTGRLLTVVGRLVASEVRSIGEFDYTYPVMEAIEMKPWSPTRKTSPSFHFGIGVGTWF
jgi:outer membrane lipoprotein